MPTGERSWYRIVNKAPDVAEVYIYEEIGMWGITANAFVKDLRGISQNLIKLHINSPGGAVDDGIAIMNALKSHPASVEVHVDALAASIASVVAMAGDRVVMAPHSRMIIHEAMAVGMGYAEDHEQVAAMLRETTQNIASIYAARAGKDNAYWLGKMKAETRFSDQQAVDEGLADEIGLDEDFGAFRIAANFKLAGFRGAAAIKAELLALVPVETNSGRTMSQANLDKLHDLVAGATTIHNGTCDMGEDCPMAGEANRADPPEKAKLSPRDAARLELEEALAKVQL